MMISARRIPLSGSAFRKGAGILAVLAVMLGAGCAHHIQQGSGTGSGAGKFGGGERSEGGVHFTIAAPGAQRVTLVLMSSSEGPPMSFEKNAKEQKGGIWIADLDLLPGEYRYFFVVDGSVTVQKGRGRVETDDFGGETGILTVLQGPDGRLIVF